MKKKSVWLILFLVACGIVFSTARRYASQKPIRVANLTNVTTNQAAASQTQRMISGDKSGQSTTAPHGNFLDMLSLVPPTTLPAAEQAEALSQLQSQAELWAAVQTVKASYRRVCSVYDPESKQFKTMREYSGTVELEFDSQRPGAMLRITNDREGWVLGQGLDKNGKLFTSLWRQDGQEIKISEQEKNRIVSCCEAIEDMAAPRDLMRKMLAAKNANGKQSAEARTPVQLLRRSNANETESMFAKEPQHVFYLKDQMQHAWVGETTGELRCVQATFNRFRDKTGEAHLFEDYSRTKDACFPRRFTRLFRHDNKFTLDNVAGRDVIELTDLAINEKLPPEYSTIPSSSVVLRAGGIWGHQERTNKRSQ